MASAMFKLRTVTICWNKNSARRGYVVGHGILEGIEDYEFCIGYTKPEWRAMTDEQRMTKLLETYVLMTMRDRIPAWTAYRALMCVEEFAQGIGAEAARPRKPKPKKSTA